MEIDMNHDLVEELQRIGLNEYESKAFAALLNEDPLTAGQISKKADIPRPRAYDILESLEKKGLCSIQPGRPTKYKSKSLKEAINNLKTKKEKQYRKEIKKIEGVKQKLENKIQKKEKTKEKEDPHDFLWYLGDKDKVNSKVKELLKDSEKEVVLVTDSEDALEHLEEYEKELQEAKDRGASIKIITDNANRLERAMEFAEIQEKEHKHRFMAVDDHSILFLTPKEEKDVEVGAWVKSPFFTQGLKHKLDE